MGGLGSGRYKKGSSNNVLTRGRGAVKTTLRPDGRGRVSSTRLMDAKQLAKQIPVGKPIPKKIKKESHIDF